MSLQNLSLNGVVLALIALSVYIGVQIDYRHWTWIVFLVVLPATLAVLLMLHVRRGARQQRQAQDTK